MYSKQQASQLRQEFWTAFGQYMSPVLSAEGGKVAWVNYKTGIRDIHFKMNANGQQASVAIEITHTDIQLQTLFFEQFVQLKNVLHQALGEEWIWLLHTQDEHGHTISRIYTQLQGVSVFNREDWPRLISFFKPRMISLDDFWSSARHVFEML